MDQTDDLLEWIRDLLTGHDPARPADLPAPALSS
jgi:hypothetical protein